MTYEQAKKLIGQQPIDGAVTPILTEMCKDEYDRCWIAHKAYLLGVINGKRAERSRRAKAGATGIENTVNEGRIS